MGREGERDEDLSRAREEGMNALVVGNASGDFRVYAFAVLFSDKKKRREVINSGYQNWKKAAKIAKASWPHPEVIC